MEGRTLTVVPGMTVYVPHEAWHGLRNTGTGILQLTWTSAPAGLEEFFRELSRAGSSADAATIQQIAQRHGVEFRPSAEPDLAGAAPGRGRRRRHRGGKEHRRARVLKPPLTPAVSTLASHEPPVASAPVEPQGKSSFPHPSGWGNPSDSVPAPSGRHPEQGPPAENRGPRRGATPPAPSAPTQTRRRRGRRGRGRGHRPASPVAAPAARRSPAAPKPSATPAPSRSRSRPHRRRHVKEVYMGGRWVQVSGEGPVIAPGQERPGPAGQRPPRDDDTPAGPLTVPL